MRVKVSAIFLLLVLLVAVIAGCSSGDNQSGGGETQGGGKTKKEKTAKEVTTVEGTLGRVDLEKKRITLRPDGGGEPLRLRFNPEAAKVTVAGEKASAEALESRRRAEVQYFERKDKKVARNVNITSDVPQREGTQSGGATG